MNVPRWLAVLLVVAMVTNSLPAAPATAQRTLQRLGHGARFAPADTALYLSVDLDPSSDQFARADRLVRYYLGLSSVVEGLREIGLPLGISVDADESWRELTTWVGGEVFLAVPSVDDLRSEDAFALGPVNVDCREPGVLFGIAIGNLAAFEEFLGRSEINLRIAGTRTRTERYGETDLMAVGGSPEGGSTYLAMHDGYLLVSGSRGLLTQAIDRAPSDSLAASPSFQESTTRFADDSFALVYAAVPDDLLFFGDRGDSRASTRWIAGGLRLGADSVQVDLAASLNADLVSTAVRALLATPPNAVRSANVAATGSSFFLGWQNLKQIWNVVKEQIPAATYQDLEEEARSRAGIDLDADVFDWMTGEFTIFAAPAHERSTSLGELGFGVAIEARDRELARQKADKYLEAARRLLPADQQPSPQEIAELTFYRFPIMPGFALYGQLVEDWLIVTSDAGLAEDVIASLRGQGGLQGQAEYQLVRAALPNPLHLLAYADAAALLAELETVLGDDVEEAQDYLNPLRGVGLGVATSADRVEASLFVHLVLPTGVFTRPTGEPVRDSTERRGPEVLIDASKSAEVWWLRDEEPSARQLPGGGAPFLRYLKDEVGLTIGDTVFPDERIGRIRRGRASPSSPFGGPGGPTSDQIIEPFEPFLIRVGADGAYDQDELTTYRDYVYCGGRLLLLADGQRPGLTDELAETFGLHVAGVVAGQSQLSDFRPHRATEGALPISAERGTGLVGWDEATEVLGLLPPGGYLDLNGNGQRDEGEPAAAPVLAVRPFGRGVVVFLGTTSVLSQPGHPTLRALLRFLTPDAPWPGPLRPDVFEPDDNAFTARTLQEETTRQSRTIHEPGDADWVRYTLEENQRTRLSAIATVDECAFQITLYGADAETVLAQSRNLGAFGAAVEYRATESGTYYAEILQLPQPFDTCRAYMLTSRISPPPMEDEAEPDDVLEQARPLPIESRGPTRSIHAAGDVDWSAVELQRGERLRVSLFPEAFDCGLELALRTPDGRLIEGESFGPIALLDYTATSDGRYHVRVQATDPTTICDSYRLDVRLQRALPPDAFEPDDTATQAKPLPLDGSSQTRSLNVIGDSDWVTLSLNQGDRVRIFTRSRDCDTYLYLYGTDGQTVLMEDDDSGEGSNSLIIYTPAQTGTYYARVRHYNERTGACDGYTLTATVEPARPPSAPGSALPIPSPTPVPVSPTPVAPARE
jgi:hypothetical protein